MKKRARHEACSQPNRSPQAGPSGYNRGRPPGEISLNEEAKVISEDDMSGQCPSSSGSGRKRKRAKSGAHGKFPRFSIAYVYQGM